MPGIQDRSNTTIAGGNLLSQELNLSAGNGTTNGQCRSTEYGVLGRQRCACASSDARLDSRSSASHGDLTYYNDAVEVIFKSQVIL